MKKNIIRMSLAALLAGGCASPLVAASFKAGEFDLTLGGSVRLDAGYQQSDLGDGKLVNAAAAAGAVDYGLTAPAGDRLDYFAKLPSNSRLKFGAARDELKAYVELGFGPTSSTSGSDAVKTRHAYLTYTSGKHSLLIGQTDIPVLSEKPGQVLDDENGLCGFGDLDLSRRSQIKYSYKTGKLTVEAALADNYVKNSPKTVGGPDLTKYQMQESTPAVAARLTYKDERVTLAPSVYWQRFEYEGNSYDSASGAPIKFGDLRAQSYVVGLDASLKLEPVKVAASAWYGQNPYLIASTDKRPASDISYRLGQPVVAVSYAGASAASADLQDVTAYGCWLMLSGDIGKNTVNVGTGYESGKVETGLTAAASRAQYRDKLITRGAFVNVKVPVKGGFFIQPELAYYDHGNDANRLQRSPLASGLKTGDLGSEVFAGVHFQYDF